MSKPNRRKFITPDGRIVETNFDVFWFGVSNYGIGFLFEEEPVFISVDFSIKTGSKFLFAYGYRKTDKPVGGLFYLTSKGIWVRKSVKLTEENL